MEDLVSKFERLKDERNSLVILGLDPKDRKQRNKVIELVQLEENLIGFKPNAQFYQTPLGQELLEGFQDVEGIRIIDAKLADGTNTNKAAINSYAPNFDAVTLNTPDVEGSITAGKDERLDSIIMGAMSFPSTLRRLSTHYGVEMLKDEINRGVDNGAQGIVIGATSYVPDASIGEAVDKLRRKIDDDDIEHRCIGNLSNDDLAQAIHKRNDVFGYCAGLIGNPNCNLVALVPGFGRQGGQLEHFLESGIDLDRCIINAGSAVLKADNPQKELEEFNAIINSYRN